jgi:NAD(P)-dependent dehydrogenase (short-subunit alcohol dehydrogenase family)
MDVAGRSFLVTGATGGIGGATVRALVQRGARVAATGTNADRLDALAAELPDVVAIRADLIDAGQARDLIDGVVGSLGGLDGLVNCAGRGMFAGVESIDLGDLVALFDLNVVAPLRLMQLAIPHMRAQGGGRIVNISSMSTVRVVPPVAGYAATKCALNALSLAANAQLSEANITVALIRPGIVESEFGNNATTPEPRGLRHAPDGSVLPHILTAAAVAAAICDLIESDESEVNLVP